MFLIGWFRLPSDADIMSEREPNWPWPLLWSFDVRREYNIYLSVCGRHTINCGILQIQNTQTDHAEVARCTLAVSCLTNLAYCFVSVDWVSVFVEHVHWALKAFERFKPNCSAFWHSKHHTCSNIHLKSESITGQLWNQSSWQNFQAVLRQLFLH